MIIYQAYFNGTDIKIERMEIKSASQVVAILNRASEFDNGPMDELGSGLIYGKTKSDVLNKIESMYAYWGISLKDLNIDS